MSATQPVPASRRWLVLLLPAGFALGVTGGFLQEHRLMIGEWALPWASLLVVATLVASIRAVSLNLATRMAGALIYSGWLVATALLALPNPSGDVVFTSDPGAIGYLLAGTVLGAAASAWPLFLPQPSDTVESLPGPSSQ